MFPRFYKDFIVFSPYARTFFAQFGAAFASC